MVAGYAIGGGHVLHMICDLTIAADNARFGQTGPRVGSFDGGYGASYMARIVGQKKAREIWFLWPPVRRASRARHGLVNAVVPYEAPRGGDRAVVPRDAGEQPHRAALPQGCAQRRLRRQAGLQELAGNATLLFYLTRKGRRGRTRTSRSERRTSASSAGSPEGCRRADDGGRTFDPRRRAGSGCTRRCALPGARCPSRTRRPSSRPRMRELAPAAGDPRPFPLVAETRSQRSSRSMRCWSCASPSCSSIRGWTDNEREESCRKPRVRDRAPRRCGGDHPHVGHDGCPGAVPFLRAPPRGLSRGERAQSRLGGGRLLVRVHADRACRWPVDPHALSDRAALRGARGRVRRDVVPRTARRGPGHACLRRAHDARTRARRASAVAAATASACRARRWRACASPSPHARE